VRGEGGREGRKEGGREAGAGQEIGEWEIRCMQALVDRSGINDVKGRGADRQRGAQQRSVLHERAGMA
jgi:hypothetical protein